MVQSEENLYVILGVSPSSTFEEIKSAFRTLAKKCHPDLHGDDPVMTAEFQKLIGAFDVLSDPEARLIYDRQRHQPQALEFAKALRSNVIMDTLADDILEEMVVGNNVPEGTTLKTLMLDMERTETFITFRQAKNCFYHREYAKCRKLCEYLTGVSDENILYHYYLAESARLLGHIRQAARHFRICMKIGALRNPPQRLAKVRRHYRLVQEKNGIIGKIVNWFMGEDTALQLTPEEEMRRGIEQAFARELGENHSRKHQKRLPRGR